MKKLLIILILATSAIQVKSQSPIAYYDAVHLKDLYNQVNQGGPAKIKMTPGLALYLKYYYPDATTIMDSIGQNPFLKDFFSNGGSAGFTLGGAVSVLGTAIGNANVTTFTDGLAKFLVARAKEELNVAFFRKFQDWLTTHPEAEILFPSTAEVIGSVASYNYAAILPALSAAFQKDFNAIGTNLLKLRDVSNYAGYGTIDQVTTKADIITKYLNIELGGRSIMAGVVGINSIIKGNNPAQVIADIAEDPSCDQGIVNDNLSNSVHFINLLSQSLRSADTDRVWITKKEARIFTEDIISLKLYFGLLYAIDRNSPHPISFHFKGTTVTLQNILTKLADVWNIVDGIKFRQHFKTIVTTASEVADNTIPLLAENNKSGTASIADYADYTSSISNLIRQAANLLQYDSVLNPIHSAVLNDLVVFTAVVDDVTSSCYDIKIQNYGALVIHTADILGYVLSGRYKFRADYIKYGSFMASILTAKNSDEVASAIDAAVLPAGSSSVKRETDFNISLNAYLGLYGGIEYMPVLKTQQKAFSMGVTAPVGIAFSWGNFGKGSKNTKGGKSVTLFVSLIDIGAMAAFRFNNDSSDVASTVQLKNIISPGIYGYYGLGKCPLSIGLGAQIGPQLRGITATDININNNFYIRFALNVVLDIPFFNFYTRQNNSD